MSHMAEGLDLFPLVEGLTHYQLMRFFGGRGRETEGSWKCGMMLLLSQVLR